jgi:hypothetical protein
MKQLPIQFGGTESDTFTQIARSDKGAIYKRETPEGAFNSFEVFGILTKDDEEIYPQKHAFGKWAWTLISEDRANTYLERINAGDIVIPAYDPTTSEMPSQENDLSLEELLAQDEVSLDPTAPSTPPVETPILDVTLPTLPEVAPTADGGAVVTVAKVKKEKAPAIDYIIPSGEFSQKDFAHANNIPERPLWGKINRLVESGKIVKVLRADGKGRSKAFYTAAPVIPAAEVVAAPPVEVPVEISLVETPEVTEAPAETVEASVEAPVEVAAV